MFNCMPSLFLCDPSPPWTDAPVRVRAAASEGSIPMQEGEQLLVIELDQGDGWTRVRRQGSLEEGFVPTAYLQVLLHPAC